MYVKVSVELCLRVLFFLYGMLDFSFERHLFFKTVPNWAVMLKNNTVSLAELSSEVGEKEVSLTAQSSLAQQVNRITRQLL